MSARPVPDRVRPMSTLTHRRLWRAVAGLALAHLVLMFGSFALQRVAPLAAGPATVAADHVTWSMTKGFAGGYLTGLSFLLFLLAATLLARLLRGGTELSGWLASSIAAVCSIYVAVTLVGELANLGAALYDGHHGAPLATVAALDHVHWFALYLATAVLGLFTVLVAAAIRVTRGLPRWVGHTGFVVGTFCLVAVPAAGTGAVDAATAVWSLWFLGLAVAALRQAGRLASPGAARPLVAGVPA